MIPTRFKLINNQLENLTVVLLMCAGINVGFSLIYANATIYIMRLFPDHVGLVGALCGFSTYGLASLCGIIVSKIEVNSTLPLLLMLSVLNVVLVISFTLLIAHVKRLEQSTLATKN